MAVDWDFYSKSCYDLIAQGEFSLSNEEYAASVGEYVNDDEKYFLEGTRAALQEWLACELLKTNYLTYRYEELDSPFSESVTTISQDMDLFIELSKRLRKLKEVYEWKERYLSNGGYYAIGLNIKEEATRHGFERQMLEYASKPLLKISEEINAIRSHLSLYLRTPGLVGPDVKEAYKTIARSLILPSHDKAFWLALRGELESQKRKIRHAYSVSNTASYSADTPEQARINRQVRNNVQRAQTDTLNEFDDAMAEIDSFVAQIDHDHQILSVKVDFFGDEMPLYRALDTIYREDLVLDTDIISSLDDHAIPLIRQAITTIKEKNRKAMMYSLTMGDEDILRLIKIDKLRELVVKKLGTDYAATAAMLHQKQLDKEYRRRKLDRNMYYAGAVISTIGGILITLASGGTAPVALAATGRLVVPRLVVIGARVALFGSAVILATTSVELYKTYFNDYRKTMKFINVASDENIQVMEEGTKVFNNLKYSLVSWGMAVLGAAVTVKWNFYTNKVLANAPVRQYSPQKLVYKLKKARIPVYVKTTGRARQWVVLATNRTISLSRNGDRLVGLMRRWTRLRQAASSLSPTG